MNLKISTLVTWAILLVLAQLLLTQWTVHAAGNRDVLDYVSFAGTVVGMILAILAIVYSYLANASQKSDSEAVRAQVSNLNEAITRANASGNQFAVELTRLEDIRESLSQVSANSVASLAASARLEEQIVSLKTTATGKSPSRSAAPAEIDTVKVASFFASNATPYQVPLYFIAANFAGTDAAERQTMKKLLIDSWIPQTSTAEFWRDYYWGEFMGYYWVLYDLGIVKNPAALNTFRIALLDRAKKVTAKSIGDDATVDQGKLQTAIDSVVQRLEREITK